MIGQFYDPVELTERESGVLPLPFLEGLLESGQLRRRPWEEGKDVVRLIFGEPRNSSLRLPGLGDRSSRESPPSHISHPLAPPGTRAYSPPLSHRCIWSWGCEDFYPGLCCWPLATNRLRACHHLGPQLWFSSIHGPTGDSRGQRKRRRHLIRLCGPRRVRWCLLSLGEGMLN